MPADLIKGWLAEDIQEFQKKANTRERIRVIDDYQELTTELEQDPEWQKLNNVERIYRLLEMDRVPPFEKAELAAFAKILDIAAATPEDETLIKARLNNQDFSAGVPDPIVFLQTEIFSGAAEGQESGISDATQHALAKAFKITPVRIRNASELQDETLRRTIDPETEEATYAYSEKNPLLFRPGVGAYPDAQGREYITATNQHGEVLTKDVTHMTHDQRTA